MIHLREVPRAPPSAALLEINCCLLRHVERRRELRREIVGAVKGHEVSRRLRHSQWRAEPVRTWTNYWCSEVRNESDWRDPRRADVRDRTRERICHIQPGACCRHWAAPGWRWRKRRKKQASDDHRLSRREELSRNRTCEIKVSIAAAISCLEEHSRGQRSAECRLNLRAEILQPTRRRLKEHSVAKN